MATALTPRGETLPWGNRVNLRFIDWIWHVRGSLMLAPGQSNEDAFARLDPLFRESGTSHERTNDTLTFRKKDQAAQDKMAVFDSGTLRIEEGEAGPVLRYHLVSRALLFCFLVPLLFLAMAQITAIVVKHQKAGTEAVKTDKKADDKPAPQLNAVDKFLGAPAPEKPKKGGEDGPGKRGRKPSTTPAYVFAAIFAALYVGGRILEDRLIRSLFRKRLLGA